MVKDVAASVHERLSQLARARGDTFEHVLTRYGLERLLYRMMATEHGERFVLKGAMLFAIWSDTPHRPTMDVDFLAHGDSDMANISAVFKAVCRADVPQDGLSFDPDSIRVEETRDGQEYDGLRVRLSAKLGAARIPLQIDIGFGDAVTPEPIATEYPALLDFPAPELKTYPKETVIAEKFEAMVRLGMTNSRMKDFYDVWLLSEENEFDGQLLATAITRTFKRRKTPLPEGTPIALQDAFALERERQMQWTAFLRKIDASNAPDWQRLCERLQAFLMPLYGAMLRSQPLSSTWRNAKWIA